MLVFINQWNQAEDAHNKREDDDKTHSVRKKNRLEHFLKLGEYKLCMAFLMFTLIIGADVIISQFSHSHYIHHGKHRCGCRVPSGRCRQEGRLGMGPTECLPEISSETRELRCH